MLEKNVVLIETIDSLGTGFMIPCKYTLGRKEYTNRKNTFVIITNLHVLGSCYQYPERIQEYIKLTIYDDFENKVCREDIIFMQLFSPKEIHFDDKSEDIVAFLVVLRDNIAIHVCEDLCTDILENRTSLFVEGYPGVLLDEDINQRIRLLGMEKTLFPMNHKIGAYQITDDYHWYGDLTDSRLLQGLSGSPVFIQQKGKEMVIGINQSVSFINEGHNPFKIVYYLKINHILEFLTKQECIIFKKASDTTYELEWILEAENSSNFTNKISLLMIGGSGAGKSSIAKDFAYHGKYLKSTNDGQTTRTDVIYNYKLFQKSPNVKVKFFTQEKFINQMMNHSGTYHIRLLFQKLFMLKYASIEDEKAFLSNLYQVFKMHNAHCDNERMKIEEKIFTQILDALQDKLKNEELLELYDDILDNILDSNCYLVLQYVLDENWIKTYLENINENLISNVLTDEFIKIIENATREYRNTNEQNKFEKFAEDIFLKAVNCQKVIKCSEREVINSIYERVTSSVFKKQYISYMLKCQGFFDIAEFRFLFQNKEYQDHTNNSWENMINPDLPIIKLEVMKNKDEIKKSDLSFYECLKEIYKNVFKILKKAILIYQGRVNEHTDITNIPLQIEEITFNQLTREKQLFLDKCLQVTPEGSLTGVIDYVAIEDKISNEYASILREFELNQLQIIDTCGLDHINITSEKDIIRKLNNLYYSYFDKNNDLIAVLFVKKLDAGKPDELRQLLPCIRKSIPKAPVYCLFSGIDIFYHNKLEVQSIDWTEENNRCPKAVQYLMEQRSKAEEYEKVQYNVLCNNLIPYCGDKKLVNQHFYLQKNNYHYIRKLIASISMLEASSMEITELNQEYQDKLKNIISVMIHNLFKNASLKSYKFRWNTVQADDMSIKKGHIGNSLTYQHCFYELFHEAYITTMNEYVAEAMKGAEIFSQSVYATMYQIEKEFLGENENLYEIDLPVEKKNFFRIVLEKMYGLELFSGYNIFDKKLMEEVLREVNKTNRYVIFDQIFNFEKGIEGKILLDYSNFRHEEKDNLQSYTVQSALTEKYVEILKGQIDKNNTIKAIHLTKLSESYEQALLDMEKEFNKKYEGTVDFNKVMLYYFKKR